MMVRVVKIGGRVLEDSAWLGRFADFAARSPHGLVVVHGGGPEADAYSRRLGIVPERVAGRRVTSPEVLDVLEMVLAGRLNKRLVRALASGGVDAIGLSGQDGSLLVAEGWSDPSLGRVAEDVRVRVELLRGLLGLGLVPVVAPVSRGEDGGAVNVNADDVAMAVAAALRADELLFVTDVPGVRDRDGARSHLDAGEAEALIASGVADGGMGIKLAAGLKALREGVSAVRIGPLEMLVDASAGTRVGGFGPAEVPVAVGASFDGEPAVGSDAAGVMAVASRIPDEAAPSQAGAA